MRKMMKVMGVLITLFVFIFLLASCSSKKSKKNNGSSGYNVSTETFNYHMSSDEVYRVSISTTSLEDAYVYLSETSTSFSRINLISSVGHVFEGAYSSPDGKGIQYFDASGRIISGLILSEGIDIYPVWTLKSYKIIFKNGETQKETTCSYGQTYDQFDIVSKEGYTFNGWMYNDSLITNEYGYLLTNYKEINEKAYDLTKEEIILQASLDINKYTVTFDYNGYDTNTTEIVEHGSQVSDLPNVGVEYIENGLGVELLGWSKIPGSNLYFDKREAIKEDLVLYANFKQFKDFEIMYEGEKIGQTRIYNGDVIKIEDLREGITPGYKISDAYTSESLSGGSRITQFTYFMQTNRIYVRLEPIDYNITYVVGEGETIIESTYPTTFNCETKVLLPTAEKAESVFTGWSLTKDGTPYKVGKSVIINAFDDVKLYPIFKSNDAIIHIQNSSNEYDYEVFECKYGDVVKLDVPIDRNYVFKGYYYIEDGEEFDFTDELGNALAPLKELELTVIARWTRKLYITVVSNPEDLVAVETNEYYINGDLATLTTSEPEHYTFIGWRDVDAIGVNGEIVNDELTYSFNLNDRNYYFVAEFEPEEYDITLEVLDGATCSKDSAKVKYKETFILPVAIKDGYLFAGWYLGDTKVADENGVSVVPWTFGNATLTAKLNASSDGYILISSNEDFLSIKDATGKKYLLTKDLTISGWESINFTGVLNGGGYTISGLNKSLFKSLIGKVVNLNIDTNIDLNNDEDTNIGAVAYTLDGGTISNVTVNGTIKAIGKNLGGFVGKQNSGSIVDSINNAEIKGTATNVGGFVGQFVAGTVLNPINYGNVKGKTCVGGIIGYLGTVNNNRNTTNLNNYGDITGGDYTGGIIGRVNQAISVDANYTSTYKDLYNYGVVAGANYTGGIIGHIVENNTGTGNYGSTARYITTSFEKIVNRNNVIGQSNVGGLIGYILVDPNTSATIKNSSSSANIRGTYIVGGLIGWIDNDLTMNSCSNANSTIIATSYQTSGTDYNAYVGGYVGRGAYVYNCENNSSILYTEKGRFVGGIAGALWGHIQDSKNYGEIKAESSSYVGGLVGYFIATNGNRSYLNLENYGNVSGVKYVGGISGKIDQSISVDANYTANLKNIINKGEIKAKEGGAGGIVGSVVFDNTGTGNYGSTARYITTLAEKIYNYGNVTTSSGYVGGLFGYFKEDPHQAGSITDSKSSAKVIGDYYVGGLIGWIDNDFTIRNCSNSGSKIIANEYITSGTDYNVYLGGYVGKGSFVYGCTNDADITYISKGRFVGGIAGELWGHIQDSENNGDIIATKSSYVGGLVGYFTPSYGNRTYSNLVNNGYVKGVSYVGGIAGKINQAYSVDGDCNVNLTDLTNNGLIIATGNYAGGIAGSAVFNNKGTGNYGSTQRYISTLAEKLTNTSNVTATTYVGGLFGYFEVDNHKAGTLSDSSSNATITAEYIIGGLIGWIENDFTVRNCTNEGTTLIATGYETSGTDYNAYLGGYVGRGSSVTGCINNVEINYTEKGRFVGGIAGILWGSINNCENNANVTALKSTYVGGLVGGFTPSAGNRTYSDLKNTGAVKGVTYVGGIAGKINQAYSVDGNYTINIKKIENTGDVEGTGNYVGGIAGSAVFNNTGTGNYGSTQRYIQTLGEKLINNANIKGISYVAGLFGYLEGDAHIQSTIMDSKSSGNITVPVAEGNNVGKATGKIVNQITFTDLEEESVIIETGE